MTDYRARIREALDETYGIDPATEIRHEAAVARLVDLFRDLTRDLSEQVAQLRQADAERAARDLGVGEQPVLLSDKPVLFNKIMRALVDDYGWVPLDVRLEAATAAVRVAQRWTREVGVQPSPDAVSTPTPAPAGETAREGGGEAHSGAQGSDGSEVGHG